MIKAFCTLYTLSQVFKLWNKESSFKSTKNIDIVTVCLTLIALFQCKFVFFKLSHSFLGTRKWSMRVKLFCPISFMCKVDVTGEGTHSTCSSNNVKNPKILKRLWNRAFTLLKGLHFLCFMHTPVVIIGLSLLQTCRPYTETICAGIDWRSVGTGIILETLWRLLIMYW